jgi:hypothetical protein
MRRREEERKGMDAAAKFPTKGIESMGRRGGRSRTQENSHT